jgi:hypothetical protein
VQGRREQLDAERADERGDDDDHDYNDDGAADSRHDD